MIHMRKDILKWCHRRRQPMRRRSRASFRASFRGFTLVELLIAVALIIVLLSLLIVALNRVTRGAQEANTTALMTNIGTALEQFKTELGYLPPVLNEDRAVVTPPNFDEPMDMNFFFSATTLPDYLIGYGPQAQDGYGFAPNDVPFLGIRDPGSDGAWNAVINGSGSLADRNPVISGKVYGPYLSLRDERLLGSISGGVVSAAGDPGYDPDAPKVLLDYWGEPIRYYRNPYPIESPKYSYTRNDYDGDGQIDRPASLADVFVIRPWTVNTAEVYDALADASGDTTTSKNLAQAEWAVHSSGADRRSDTDVRRDAAEFNEDDLVEAGP